MAAARADRLEDEARELLTQADRLRGSKRSTRGSGRSSSRGRKDRGGRKALFRLAVFGGVVLAAPTVLDNFGMPFGEFIAEMVFSDTQPR